MDSIQSAYDEVYAQPDANEPRRALADLLERSGDPHGEFIRLQLATREGKPSREAEARVRALQRQHQKEWLGPLRDFVATKELRFERGFPSAARVNLDGAPCSTRWSTFEELAIGTPSLILSPDVFPSVRRVGLSGAALAHVLGDPRWRLDRVQLFGFLVPEEIAALSRAAPVPQMRELGFAVDARSVGAEVLWSSALFDQLSAVSAGGYRFPELIERATSLRALRRIGRADGYGWRLVRRDGGTFARLDYSMFPGNGEGGRQNLPMLESLKKAIPAPHRRVVTIRGARATQRHAIGELFRDAEQLLFEPAERSRPDGLL